MKKCVQATLFDKEKKIILVGNGPSVTSKPFGTIIDSFDTIIRFNDFKIKKKFTGMKTDIHVRTLWMMNRSFVKNAYRLIIPIVPVIGCADFGFLNYFGCHIISYKIIQHAYKYLPEKKIPTSGLIILLYLIYELKLKNITIVGFDGFDPKSTYDDSHYFDSQIQIDKKYFGVHHCNEKQIFAKLIKQYNIKVLK